MQGPVLTTRAQHSTYELSLKHHYRSTRNLFAPYNAQNINDEKDKENGFFGHKIRLFLKLFCFCFKINYCIG